MPPIEAPNPGIGYNPADVTVVGETIPTTPQVKEVSDDASTAKAWDEEYGDLISEDDFAPPPEVIGDTAEPQVPVVTAPQIPQVPPTTQTTPAPTPQENSVPAQTAQIAPVTSAPQQISPEDLTREYQTFFDNTAKMLSEQVYVLDEPTREKLDTNPSEVIPMLAGRLHMQILTAAVTQMANMFPQMLAEHSERNTIVQQRESSFFTQFPDLAGHKETVQRMAMAYRNANPSASLEQAVQEIGTMSRVSLRLPVGGNIAPPQGQQMTPPVVPTAVRGGGGAMLPAATASVWDELISDVD